MRIPGYQIERELGQGGMAIVYLAMQESLRRYVALKVIKPILTTDEEFAQRFLREGRIIAQLNDPHIITVYDIASHEGIYYLSMEYLPGGSLQQRIRDGIPLEETLTVARSVAEALHYAHHRGVIHRDIKPQNILFRENGSVVLTDFGIAKTLGSSTAMTRTGLSIGTPRYMSPEQIRGRNVDTRADLYSFGVLFYEMLTGNVPYLADDSFALAMMHVTAPIPELPEELHRFQPLLNKLLDKEPDQRFQNGHEFITALSDLKATPATALDSFPITRPKPQRADATPACTPSPPRRAHGWKAGILATVLASLALAGSYLFLQQPSPPTSVVLSSPTTPPPVADIADSRRAEAEQRLAQARQRQQDGALEDSLNLIEQGLQFAPDHAELLALRDQVNRQITDAQTHKVWEDQRRQAKLQADQFLDQAQRAQQEGALDRSLAHIEQGLQFLPDHSGLLALKKKVQVQHDERLRQEETAHQQATAEERRKAEVEQRRQKADEWLARALDSQRNRAYETSLSQIEQGLQQLPDYSRLLALRDTVRQQLRETKAAPPPVAPVDRTAALLQECANHLQANRLTSGKGGNAVDCYNRILQRDPGNAEARAGLEQVANRYADWAEAAARRGDAKAANSALSRLELVDRHDPRIADIRNQLTSSATTKPVEETPSPSPKKPTENPIPPLVLISPPQPQDATPSDADQAWVTVKDSANPAEIEQFLADYPKSRHASTARSRLKQLQKQPAVSTARLAVKADQENAEVWINGRRIDTAPMEVDLKPGSYKVRVHREGYEDWSGQVDLKAGDDDTLSALLSKKPEIAVVKPVTPPQPPKPEPDDAPPLVEIVPPGQPTNCLRGNCENGEGVYQYQDGSKYSGQFRNAKMHGQGTYVYARRGEKYVGEWRNGVINGQGTYYYRSGNRYDGEWRNGKKQGQGTYLYADRGEKYVGDFANDQPNGQGVYYYSNGDRYEGEWRNGRKNGQGVLYESDRKIVGEWQNDQKARVTVEQ